MKTVIRISQIQKILKVEPQGEEAIWWVTLQVRSCPRLRVRMHQLDKDLQTAVRQIAKP